MLLTIPSSTDPGAMQLAASEPQSTATNFPVSPARPQHQNEGMVSEDGYLLDNRQAEAGQRFVALSELFNPWTFAHMRRLGISEGWQCWEVGAGGPTVPSWMAEQVGPHGSVLATDIDLSWIRDGARFESRRHELGVDPIPEGPFDLVHARLVLVHVEARQKALTDLVAALRPGGWLLIEEADPELQPLVCPDEVGPTEVLANRLKSGFRTLMTTRGVDLAYGRKLPRLLRSAGLVEIQADAFFPVSSPACNELEIATTEQIRHRLTAVGLATDEEIDEHLANVRSGTMDLTISPLVSTWGKKPR
jgi:SAM-dependent methyltransferase